MHRYIGRRTDRLAFRYGPTFSHTGGRAIGNNSPFELRDVRISVFCVLKAIDRVRMHAGLEEAMNLKVDQMMIIDLGPDEEVARQAAVLRLSLPQRDKRTVVV